MEISTGIGVAVLVHIVAIYFAYSSITEKRIKWFAISMIVVSLIISFSFYTEGYKIGTGYPREITDNKTFNDVFSQSQVYFLLNEHETYADDTIGVLLAKTDNDFGNGTGEIYGISYNPNETKFYRISNAYINISLRTNDLIINKDGKLERYFPKIEP